jgi:hypothetical protein
MKEEKAEGKRQKAEEKAEGKRQKAEDRKVSSVN